MTSDSGNALRVLFIGKRFYTNRDAYTERFGRIYQLPYWWAKAGHEVDLWLVDYHGRNVESATDAALKVESTPVFRWRFLVRLITALFGPIRRHRKDVVVASGDCYLGLIAYCIARLRGATFVFDMYDRYDLFAGYRRPLGIDLQEFLLRRADLVLFASALVMKEFGGQVRKAALVPNGVDTERFQPLPLEESRRKLGLPDDEVLVGYFGSMEPDRGISDLIDAVRSLFESGMNVRLLVGGRENPDISLDHEWVLYLGNLDFARMPAALSSCDVLALPYRQSDFMDSGASCKIAEYIAAGRPVVATRTPNLVSNFPEQSAQLDDMLAQPGDAKDLGRCILGQLSERRLVNLPKSVSWSEISRRALTSLEAKGRADEAE
jgi:glycosyltransferase involved in cell wall biosynthesis